jgi:hypothetical protein
VNLDVTVPVCDCHDWQTQSQRDAGVFRDHLDCETHHVWAVVHGLGGLLVAHAHAAGDANCAADGERQLRAMLRLLAGLSERPIGPNPIANTLRPSSRPPARRAHASRAQATRTLTSGVLPAIGAALSEWLPADGELLPGVAVDDAARLLAPDAGRTVARRLAAVEAHPRAGELAAAFERASALPLTFTDQLIAAVAGESGDRPVETLREFATIARALVDLFLALVAGESASGAIERFLTAIDTENLP